MLIESPYKSRERILGFGGPGAGKTTNYFHIAQHTTGKFWVIDTDQTTLPFLESEEYQELEERFEVFEPWEWPEYIEAIKEIRAKAGPDDWIVVDMMNKPWDEVQNHFSEQVYGAELADHWLKYTEQLKAADGKGSKSPFDGTTDWQAIKKMYAQFTGNLLRVKGHIYLAAPQKKVNEQFDGAGVLKVGDLKPDCQKDAPHMMRTVLHVANRRMTTGKDRQRDEMNRQAIGDFALDYLVGVAGWKVKVG